MEPGPRTAVTTLMAVSVALFACASPTSPPAAVPPGPSLVIPPLAPSLAPQPTEPTTEAGPGPSADAPQAEAAFRALDKEIAANYDRPDRHDYTTVDEALGVLELDPVTKQVVRGADGQLRWKARGKFAQNAAEAEKLDLRLDMLIKRYESPEWIAAAIERQANIYDTLRMGLANANPALFDAATLQQLASWRASGHPMRVAMAQRIEASQVDLWEKRKQKELDGADLVVVKRYATVVAYARANRISNDRVTRALGRLAFYTDLIGDDGMAAIVTATPNPSGHSASKLTYRKRQYVTSP